MGLFLLISITNQASWDCQRGSHLIFFSQGRQNRLSRLQLSSLSRYSILVTYILDIPVALITLDAKTEAG